MERKGQPPFFHKLVGRRILCGLDRGIRHAIFLGRSNYLRIERVEEDVQLAVHQIVFVRRSRFVYLVGIVQHHAQVADTAHTRVHAGRGMSCLNPRIAENALFGFSRMPIVVRLFIRAGRYAHPPGPAHVLVDQDDTVFAPFIDRPRRTGGHASRVKAVVANARQVIKSHALQLKHCLLLGRGHALKVGVLSCIIRCATQVIVPVGA